jgi:F-type H+-transporting ATPase subunit b
MPQLDISTFPPQLFWLAVTFLTMLLLMAYLGLPKVGAIIEERRSRVDSDLEKAAQMKAEAEAVIAAYEKALADARAQAQAIIRETHDRLAHDAAERQRAAATALAEQTKAAEGRIAAAKEAALGNVRTIAVEVARAATARLTGAEVDETRADAAVEAAMKERA